MVTPCPVPDPPPTPGLPSREAILDFVRTQKEAVGKREIARAFGLHAQDKIALKALLKDMQNDGELDAGPGRTLHKGGGLPRVTVIRVVEVGDDGAIAAPDRWDHAAPPPRIRVIEAKRRAAFGVGDRLLARIEEQGTGLCRLPDEGARQIGGIRPRHPAQGSASATVSSLSTRRHATT